MFMPHTGGYRYIIQARCSLTAWPEWHALKKETGRTIGAFIFKELLCRWGAVEEIVMDNGMAYVTVLDWLTDLTAIRECVAMSRLASVRQFEKHFINSLHNFNFTMGALILVQSTSLDISKTQP